MSTIPTYDQMIYPLLRVLSSVSEPLPARVIQDKVADALGLTPEQRLETLPGSPQEVYRNRVGWAHDRLKRRGLSESVKRGTWQITNDGKAFFRQHPNGISAEQAKEIASVDRSQYPLREKATAEADSGPIVLTPVVEPSIVDEPSHRSPDEALAGSLREIRESVAYTLLERLQEVTPARFESIASMYFMRSATASLAKTFRT